MEIRHLKIAVVMMARAPLKGEEAADVAEAMAAITKLVNDAEAQQKAAREKPQAALDRVENPPETEDEDGDDSRPD